MSDVLSITPIARDKVLEVRAGESDADELVLWVEVTGQHGGAFSYLMEFRRRGEVDAGTLLEDHDGLLVAIPSDSAVNLKGAELDFAASGMVMRNPNTPEIPDVFADADLSGELAQQVVALLESEVNPALASHGGHAELKAIDGTIAYLQLSGGCQGCSSASATLKQGIEAALLDAFPDRLTEVVDVTDHASGANPYYAHAH